MAIEPVRAFSFDQMMADTETFLQIQSVFSTGFCQNDCILPIAQLDRAPDYGSGGRGFESSRARMRKRPKTAVFGKYGAFIRYSGSCNFMSNSANLCTKVSPMCPQLAKCPLCVPKKSMDHRILRDQICRLLRRFQLTD